MSDSDTSTGGQTDYRSYLLRLWRVSQDKGGWRASLESVATGERRGFADLEAAFAFVRRQVRVLTDVEGPEQGGERGQDEERR